MDRLKRKAEELQRDRDLLGKVLDALPRGLPVDCNHLDLRGILVDFDEVADFVHDFRKKLETRNFTGAYAILGEQGTGKTQLALFAKHAVKGDDVEVLYWALSYEEDLRKAEEAALQKVREGKNVLLILDNLDAYLSQYTDEKELRKAAVGLATLVERLSERPHGNRGVATLLLMHTNTYNELLKKDSRLRRVEKVKELHRLHEPGEGEELALSVQAVLYAGDEKFKSCVERCGEALVDMLAKWGAHFLEVHGDIDKGLFISKCYDFFKSIASGLASCPAEGTRRGVLVEEMVKDILHGETFYVKLEKETFAARVIETEKGKGPDFEIAVYAGGGLPVGAAYTTIYGEVKSLKDAKSLKQSAGQLKGYAKEKPLLLVALAEDLESVEAEARALEDEGGGRIAALVYPLHIFEPIALVGDREERKRLARLQLGKDLASDVEWKIRMLLEAQRGVAAPRTLDAAGAARKLINKLQPTRKKEVRVGNVRKDLQDILGAEVGEDAVKSILAKLAEKGFLDRKGEKTFIVKPDAWRERRQEAEELISSVIRETLPKPKASFF